MTRYRMAVEDIEPERWIAWMIDLPGCFSRGRSELEAIAGASRSIGAYYSWLTSHDRSLPELHGVFSTEIVETFRSFASSENPHYIVNAFFDDDRRPLSYWDVEAVLRLLVWTRDDLLAVVRSATQEQLAAPLSGQIGGSVSGVLKHVAGAENWYLGQMGVAVSRRLLPEDPLPMLETVRDNARARLVELIGDDRVLKGDGGEVWSGRKIVRRALWHERVHTQHVRRLLDELGSATIQ